jgi:O-antigen/teichoic acid export membrane protein
MSVARHTAFNLAGVAVPILVGLVTVPLYLHAIGLERYGVLSIIWVLAGYFNFFDFGIGRATTQRMASLSNAPAEDRNRLFWSSVCSTAGLGLLSAVVVLPITAVAIARMTGDPAVISEARQSLPLIAILVMVSITISGVAGTLEGMRAFGAVNLISAVGSFLTATGPLATAYLIGPSIPNLVAATLLARLLVFLASLFFTVRLVPVRRPSFLDRASLMTLLKFGSWAFVSSLVGPLLVNFDRFAIGGLLGAKQVAYYVVGFNLIMLLLSLPGALTRALFPRLAELSDSDAQVRSIDAFQLMIGLATPVTVVAMLAVTIFLTLWIGPDVASHTAPATLILSFGLWANGLAQIPFIRLQAMGRSDISAKFHLIELPLYAAILFPAIWLLGIAGAALAWSLRCAVDLLLLARSAGLSRTHAISTLAPLSTLVAAYGLSRLVPFGLSYCAISLVLLSVTLAVSWNAIPFTLRRQLFDYKGILSSSSVGR